MLLCWISKQRCCNFAVENAPSWFWRLASKIRERVAQRKAALAQWLSTKISTTSATRSKD
jgi:hypothetical protein